MTIFFLRIVISLFLFSNVYCLSQREVCYDNVETSDFERRCFVSTLAVATKVTNESAQAFLLFCTKYELEKNKCEKEENYLPAPWYSND